MTPVDELREAARLMRERAEGAIDGPWLAEPYVVNFAPKPEGPWAFLTPHRHPRMPATAQHIGAWHPVVALAVADWLEREADTAARFHDGRCTKYALAVSRAYLGQPVIPARNEATR